MDCLNPCLLHGLLGVLLALIRLPLTSHCAQHAVLTMPEGAETLWKLKSALTRVGAMLNRCDPD
jgi:hypothetical protein